MMHWCFGSILVSAYINIVYLQIRCNSLTIICCVAFILDRLTSAVPPGCSFKDPLWLKSHFWTWNLVHVVFLCTMEHILTKISSVMAEDYSNPPMIVSKKANSHSQIAHLENLRGQSCPVAGLVLNVVAVKYFNIFCYWRSIYLSVYL